MFEQKKKMENINKMEVNKDFSFLKLSRKIMIEWFSTSTVHGLSNIMRIKNIFLKVIWIICFLISAIWCLFSSIRLFSTYYAYPSYVSTLIVQESPSVFPAVTICNMKLVNKTKNMQFAYTKSMPFSHMFKANISIINQFTPYELIHLTKQKIIENINDNRVLNGTSRKQIGYQIEDMLVSCYFNFKQCFANDFTYSFDYLNGNCYTFNSGKPNSKGKKSRILNVTNSDSEYSGLVLELFVGNPDVETFYEFNDGILVSIHNQSSRPFQSESKGLKAAAGAETDFKIERNFINKLPPPHGDCENESKNPELSRYMNELGLNSYSQSLCIQVCQQRESIKLCNCSNPLWPKFDNRTKYCSFEDTSLNQNCGYIFAQMNRNMLGSCFKYCPSDCESFEYDISTHTALYPNKFYAETVLSRYAKQRGLNVSTENIYKSFAKININYEKMQYKTILHKVSIKPEELFSNFGGTLSLFLGISFLSFIEIFNLGFNLGSLLLDYVKNRYKSN